jgi:hypothetical protein
METRPLSKDKRWIVSEIIRKGKYAEITPAEISEREIEVEQSDSDS